MNRLLTGSIALVGLALIRPLLQVERIVVLADRRPEDAATTAATRDTEQAQTPQKPTAHPKGGSTMR
ncbi:MAG TPA: hypothetical protein VD886_15740 [Herpetosiphonaceae bacterium]|nr:hypothetical protein [Herpetosiphonaceae bacterium]